MTAKRSLRKQLLTASLLLSWTPILILSAIWINSELTAFTEASSNLRSQLLAERKAQIKAHVHSIEDYINFMRLRTQNQLKKSLRNRIREASSAIEGLLQASKAFPANTQQELILQTLRNIRFNEGRGYYFVLDRSGTLILHPVLPDLEGTSLRERKSAQAISILSNIIDLANKQREGFIVYNWSSPVSQKTAQKISYVKLLPQLGWVLGTGEYLDTVQQHVQNEVISRLENTVYGKDGYIFAGTYEGKGLWGKFRGKSTLALSGKDGSPIVPRLIELARQGGGFISYIQPEGVGAGRASNKLSYAKGIPEWEWYVGTGLYIDDIDREIVRQYDKLQQNTIIHIISICILLLLLGAISFFCTFKLLAILQHNIQSFANFFSSASKNLVPLNKDQVSLYEFDPLAVSANEMIAARKNTEEVLRENELEQRKLRLTLTNIIDSMKPALIGVEKDLTVTLVSQFAERQYAVLPRNEAMGLPFEKVFPVLAFAAHSISNAIERGETIQLERVAVYINKTLRITCTISPLHIVPSSGAVLLIEDVTEQVRMEEVMVQTEKMLSVGGLAAGMAHEINNPLGGILQGVQNIQRRLSPNNSSNADHFEMSAVNPAQLADYLERRRIPRLLEGIRESGERAARIVDNMLKFSRKSHERFTTRTLTSLIDDAVELACSDYNVRHEYDFRKIEIVKTYNSSANIMCSPEEIIQVLLNLLRNAAQALHTQENADAAIVLRTRSEAGFGIIEVEDNGPGMTEDIRKRIFEPFFTTKPAGKGTGLGLSVSYFIVTENHKGSISVESTLGLGTHFIIKLPLQRP